MNSILAQTSFLNLPWKWVPFAVAAVVLLALGIHLIFDRACAFDLATKGTGKSVLEAVRTSINPKVISCPDPDQG